MIDQIIGIVDTKIITTENMEFKIENDKTYLKNDSGLYGKNAKLVSLVHIYIYKVDANDKMIEVLREEGFTHDDGLREDPLYYVFANDMEITEHSSEKAFKTALKLIIEKIIPIS